MLYEQEQEDGSWILVDDLSEYGVMPHIDEDGNEFYPLYDVRDLDIL